MKVKDLVLYFYLASPRSSLHMTGIDALYCCSNMGTTKEYDSKRQQ
jgi:hypothetical protein